MGAGFIKLWNRYGTKPGNNLPSDFDALVARGSAIIGDADTVRRELSLQVEASGANFLSGNFVFGDMTLAEASRSVELFASEVMPTIKEISTSAHARLFQTA
jgi:hypothetical protein